MGKYNNRIKPKKSLYIAISNDSFSFLDLENRLVDLKKDDYNNILLDHKINDDEIDKCIKTLCTFLVEHEAKCLKIDLDVIDKKFEPAKEMTLDDIEKALGYKIKIIN